ncbi:hypothetical protein GJ496_009693 [Pomphorhynchus laevis]|nr:hypothetical protein GJ496_009693 [Pomphorhynchus laevis]
MRFFSTSSGSKLWRALILGAPGSGKGTVSKRIINNFEFAHIPSGDLLRNEIRNCTARGKTAQKYELDKHDNGNWLLDGFPRTFDQAKGLDKIAALDFVVCLNVPADEIVKRLSVRFIHPESGRIYNLDFNPPTSPGLDDVTGEPLIQRDDDKPDTVRARLQLYEDQTNPLREFYRKKGILHEFFGRETNKIWPHVLKFLQETIK